MKKRQLVVNRHWEKTGIAVSRIGERLHSIFFHKINPSLFEAELCGVVLLLTSSWQSRRQRCYQKRFCSLQKLDVTNGAGAAVIFSVIVCGR